MSLEAARPLLSLLPFLTEIKTNEQEIGYTLKIFLAKDSVEFSKYWDGGTICYDKIKKIETPIFKEFSFQLER